MRLYKHHITPFLQVLLVLCALATLASCVSDKFWEQLEASRNPEPETTPYYMSLTVLNPSGSSVGNTRAVGDTDYRPSPDEFEHQVGEEGNYVILLNGDKTLYGVYPLKLYKWIQDNYEDNNEREAAYIYITHFYHDEKKALPQYGLVVMNADKSISAWLEGLPKSNENGEADILKKVWEEKSNPKKIGFGEGDGDNPKYFTLTNSAYVNDGSAQVAVKIPKDHIYKSLDLAKKNPVTVYVERMVARFDFGFEEPTAANEETETEHTYSPNPRLAISMFTGYDGQRSEEDDITYPGEIITTDIVGNSQIKVTGWGINALETQSYPFKSIAANGAADWNDEALHRYLWGMDPHYTQNNTDKYPWQFREAIQKGDLDYYEQGASPLKNYSYNDFVNKGIERTVYTPENTYNADILNSLFLDGRNNLLAGTHLIVCAELKTDFQSLKGKDGEENIFYTDYKEGLEAHDLYRDVIGVYYPTAKLCLAELVRRFNKDLTSNPVMRYHYYYWDEEDEKDRELKNKGIKNGTVFMARPDGDFQLYYYNDEEREWQPFTYAVVMDDRYDVVLPPATILNGDGQVLPWMANLIGKLDIRDSNGKKLKIYKEDYNYVEDEARIKDPSRGEPYTPERTEATRNDIKSLLLEWLGAIDHFKDGKMYYAKPIEHRLGYDDKYQAYQTGSYGVVRNTWHNITLKNIQYIGTPIDNPDQPIVPNGVVLKDQTGVTIEMLDWHEIGTNVPLPTP